ncbi:MAG: zinc ribbon domain-containing protein [Acidiferrobacter sp.]
MAPLRARVRAKSGLNKSIIDQGWADLRQQWEYKQAWRGGEVLVVPPHHTSQTYPSCRHVSAGNRRAQARFVCVACGYENNADMIGAIAILARGHRLLACGEKVPLDRSMKQEPTEATQAQAA